MSVIKPVRNKALAGSFERLVAMMPPQAIHDDAQHQATLDVIDRLMRLSKLTRGQELYLETLVQLVEVYESERHPVEDTRLRGVDSLQHLLAENDMNASDLARLLGVHASMGSKILKGARSLTVDHLRKLSARFNVRADLFME